MHTQSLVLASLLTQPLTEAAFLLPSELVAEFSLNHCTPVLQGCCLTCRSTGLFVLLLAGTPRPSKRHGGVGHGPTCAVCVGPTVLGICSVQLLIASEVWDCVRWMQDRDSKRG